MGVQQEQQAEQVEHRTNREDLTGYFQFLSETDHSPMSREEEREKILRLRGTDDPRLSKKLKAEIISSNLNFVVKIALEYSAYPFPMDDLIQEGNSGLVKALEKFDPQKGFRFLSYAIWWIRAFIQNYIMANWSLVKMGTTATQRNFFNNQLKRQRLSLEEFAEREGIDESEAGEMAHRMDNRDLSLDTVARGGEGSMMDFISGGDADDPAIALETEAQADSIRELVEEAMGELKERERVIVTRRHFNDDASTLRELGSEFKISRERIRQIEAKAFKKIKAHIRARMNGEAEFIFGHNL